MHEKQSNSITYSSYPMAVLAAAKFQYFPSPLIVPMLLWKKKITWLCQQEYKCLPLFKLSFDDDLGRPPFPYDHIRHHRNQGQAIPSKMQLSPILYACTSGYNAAIFIYHLCTVSHARPFLLLSGTASYQWKWQSGPLKQRESDERSFVGRVKAITL